ncbi:ArsR/SmtB family transcription factor [Ornithinimicrobium cavernae]|uniref:ArsR/SmtB family transcription factor n=1 Tax=Ornithinimicrobium cavernae TaxID=2666047 RepID=UPI000D69BB34|nr:winged helix-turn-helix domain-containing protein [Ornithinimicrobium cavernae]
MAEVDATEAGAAEAGAAEAGAARAEQAPRSPDYELADQLVLQDPAQYRALFEETRQAIVRMLSDRAATVTELAAALDKPKGTVGHHVQVLADAGLVTVVRTEKVRALEARYWGRTARIFFYERVGEAVSHGQRLLDRSAAEFGQIEARIAAGEDVQGVVDVNRRDVRVPHARAGEFRRRLADLLLEFADEPRAGDTTYAVVWGVFPSSAASLPDRKERS